MSKLALQLIKENKRTKDTFLDLGNCGLVNELPKELLDCVWLEGLNLGESFIDSQTGRWVKSKNIIGEANKFLGMELCDLEKLPKLNLLSFFNNQIKDISFVQNLTQLESLYLRYNQIHDIRPLYKLTQLKCLDLRSNQSQDISTLKNLNQLQVLYLSSNQIANISALNNLNQLQTLHLNDNQIHDIFPIHNLTQLQSLYLVNNQITDINALQNLSQLRTLDLTYAQVRDISALQNLTQLQTLFLSKNQIQNIDILQKLNRLEILDLRSNQIQDIYPLQNLSQLRTLDLHSNQIHDINPLQKLTQLKYLDLRSNQIQDIESLKSLLTHGLEMYIDEFKITGILLGDNPVINPPKEIIRQGREAVIRYFDRIKEEGYANIFEAKLTLVGDGGAGKTSLQRRLMNEVAELPAGNDRTRGITVHDWPFKDTEGNTYTSHIWDFGGQDVYYPVHRFFLTENAVYILMASTRYPNHNFDYWIPTIHQFGGGSPIIPVQTCDNGNQKDWPDIKPYYGEPEYNLKPIYQINLVSDDNWGLKNLKSFIQQQITELPHIGKKVPKSWVKVREQLIEKAKTIDYISFEKFDELCRQTDAHAFKKDIDTEDLAHFLHDLGIILWYAKKGLLRNFVILNPEWAMNAVYKIIDDTPIQEQNGIIYRADFQRIWAEPKYKTKIDELQLMLQVFKIAFPKQHNKQDYILPARLLPIPDEKPWPATENALRLEYHFEFLPRGLVNQISAVLSNKIVSDEHVWSDAVMLKNNTSEAQVLEDIIKGKILIKAKGPEARGMIMLIMQAIEGIISEYRGVKPLLRVPCPCIKCRTHEKPTLFEYEELLEFVEEGRKTVTCNKSDTKLSIHELLYAVGLDPTEKENHPNHDATTTKPEIFFSYAWGDDKESGPSRETIVNQLYDNLKSEKYEVKRDKNDTSYKGLISEFMDKIGKGDIVVVAISDKYLRSPYCMFELCEVFRNSKSDRAEFIKRILPIGVEKIEFNNKAVMAEYLNHWKNKKADEEKFITEFMDIAANSQFNEYKNINEITTRFNELCGILKDMNLLDLEALSKDNFAEIKNEIKRMQGGG